MAKYEGKTGLLVAVQRAGFARDWRSKGAYKLLGKDDWRVDFGAKAVRLEHRLGGGNWIGIGPTVYYGYVKSDADAASWADAWGSHVRGNKHGWPALPAPAPAKKPAAKRTQPQTRTGESRSTGEGPGFYVTNKTTGSLVRAANDGPFRSLDDAKIAAWRRYEEYLRMGFDYLLPVQIIESKDKTSAMIGRGQVWWTNGKVHGAPAHPKQMRFSGMVRR